MPPGSKAAYSALEAAGVWMHPDTDQALNSRIYQQQVLQRLTVGLPGRVNQCDSMAVWQ
jgi:hypothetical protein